MSTTAIHIEVTESMESSSFINALQQFFSITGPAKQLRSDCGTNCVGACKELGLSSISKVVEVQGNLTDNGRSSHPIHLIWGAVGSGKSDLQGASWMLCCQR